MSNIVKFAFLFVGAILIAVVVRVAIMSASNRGPAAVQSEKVRVAAADLPQGLLMRDDDLRWTETPVKAVPIGAVVENASGAIELKGALLRHPVQAGAVIVANDVILPSSPGFLAATLKPDMRAVSVAVDDVSGNAGLIEPGDYVDLLLTQQLEQKTNSPGRLVSSETVVEHVRVLASGSELSRPSPKGDGADAKQQRIRTVTLEVTPRMGEVIAVAARLGSLSLELRSFATASREGDATKGLMRIAASDSAPRPPVWAGDVSRALRDLSVPAPAAPAVAAPVAPRRRMVTVYRGSQSSDASQVDGGSAPGNGQGVPPLPGGIGTPR